jgi:precorrin-2 C20-methyltransferase/precorrin-3B C17-methyltransferase
MAAGRLTGVGVGPGDPELVTVRGARLIAEAGVVAYHCARHGRSLARAAAAPYLRSGSNGSGPNGSGPNGSGPNGSGPNGSGPNSTEQIEEVLRYPVTTEGTDHPGGYPGALADFYEEAAGRLAAHLEAGRDVVVLCEGDPGFYGSYQHLHARLRGRFSAEIVPGVSSVAAAAAAVGQPLVQHDESLTILTGTLPADVLRSRLAGAGGDAVAILKLGRTFDKVRAALADTGLLDRARVPGPATCRARRRDRPQ